MRTVIEQFLHHLFPEYKFIITESYEIYKELIGMKKATIVIYKVTPGIAGSEVAYTLEEKGDTYVPTEQLYAKAYLALLKTLWNGTKQIPDPDNR